MRRLEQSDGQDGLGQKRADLGIAEESRFQGLGISANRRHSRLVGNERGRPIEAASSLEDPTRREVRVGSSRFDRINFIAAGKKLLHQ
jgi:hypothetical protein